MNKEPSPQQALSTQGVSKETTRMLVYIAVAMVLGAVIGGFFGERVAFLGVLGDLFLRALKMIVVPLVVTSIIMGVSSLGDVRKLGRKSLITVGYYMLTTLVAVTLGLIVVNIIQPGVGVEQSVEVPSRVADKVTTLRDILLSFVADNIIDAGARTQILPLITFSILLGGALTTLGEKGQNVLNFVDGLNEAIMVIVNLIMKFAPVGIFGLIVGRLAEIGGGAALWAELSRIGWYALSVIVGLSLHAVVLGLLLLLLARREPFLYLRNLLPALATAFSTASSSATLPVTIDCVAEKNGVAKKTTGFVLPLGATINMDGTALYEAVAALFVAQVYGIHLGLPQQILVALTATLASIGAAGIPEAGLVMLVLVFQTVGLPLEGIGIILVIDWFLDRCRTTVNVWGDSVGAAVVDELDAG